MAQIEQALRSGYVVGYQPAELKLDGGLRPVKMPPLKSTMQVRSRLHNASLPRKFRAPPLLAAFSERSVGA